MAAGMVVAGAGSSVVHPTGYPLVTANVRAARKGRALGIWGSASKFGDTLSPAAVAVLVLVLTWDQVLLVLGTAGVGYALALAVVLRGGRIETRPPGTAEDAAGEATGTTEARAVLDDRRAFVYPMLAVLLFFITRGVATKGVRTFVPQFVTDVYGYSLTLFGTTVGPASLANVYFSALLFTAAVVQLVAGGLTDRYDHRKVIVGMFGLATLGLVALSYVELSPLALLVALLVVGGSIWGASPARDTLGSDISPAEWEGRTFGYLWTFASVVGTAWPVVIGYLAETIGIQASFRYLAVSALAGAGVILLVDVSCEEEVTDPILGTDKDYTLFGTLTPERDTQWVRVFPVTEVLEPIDAEGLDVTFRSTDLTTGSERVWNDSIFREPDGRWAHVYWSDFQAEHDHRYRLVAEGPDAQTASAAVTVPGEATLEVLEPDTVRNRPISTPRRWAEVPIRVNGSVPRLIKLRADYCLQYPNDQNQLLSQIFTLNYNGKQEKVPGGWTFRIKLHEDLDTFLPIIPRSREFPRVRIHGVRIRLHVVDEGWDPPNQNNDFNPNDIVQPGTMTNVEGGFGFIGAGFRLSTWLEVDNDVYEKAGFEAVGSCPIAGESGGTRLTRSQLEVGPLGDS
jgi:MFS family permease